MNKYDLRGVSANKAEVHEAIKGLDKGLYPNAFCKILPDNVGGSDEHVNIMHADTAGTKTSLAYLYWKETGDLSVWEGIAQDALVMNLDDMACVGCLENIVISSTIGRNKHLVSGDVIKTIIHAANKFVEQMNDYGVALHMAGGETADVGDIVRTIDVGYTTFGRMRKQDLIINNIQPGDVIVGLASYGQASYETAYNGGMGSNGLTSARHDVLSAFYASEFTESYDPNTDKSVIYTGSKKLTDQIEIEGNSMDLGKLILSPTRTYMPIIKKVLDQVKNEIHGMIHCTGGAQTKVKHFIQSNTIIKDNLFNLPPLFKLIQKESGTSLHEMFEVFNMGHRLEVYTNLESAKEIISIAESFNVSAKIIGRVEESESPSVQIHFDNQTFSY